MYYAIFENTPFEGKEKLAQQFYMSLLPHLEEKFKGNGFHEDTFSLAVHVKRGVNVAIFDDADAVSRWRNEENHLRLQKKGYDTVFESYRIRLGTQITGDIDSQSPTKRHCISIYSRSTFEGTPQDTITDKLDGDTTSKLMEEVVESTVYQGEKTLWITTWTSEDAAIRFAKFVKLPTGDKVVLIRVERDYTKLEREDAPRETPGAA